jgi:SPOR domain
MPRKATIITLLLSVAIMGATIWVGMLLLDPQPTSATLIAGIDPPIIDNSIPVGSDDPPTITLVEPSVEDEPEVLSVGKPTVTPSVSTVKPMPKAAAKGLEYWVQAGSFSTLARATAAFESLAGLGYTGSIVTVSQEGQLFYRLRFGAWKNVAEANRFRDYLRDQETLDKAFKEKRIINRSKDFTDAYVVSVGS